MTTVAQKPLRVFCSYSRKDEEHLNELRDSLRGLEHQGLIEWWHDREIVPGWEWEEDIDKHLRTADVILLLISRAFMASNYVYEKEIRVVVERHERGEARVIPIILRPADWQWASFGKLQALPKDAEPITTWPNQDQAWLDVVQGVRRAIGKLLRERHEQDEQYRKVLGQAWTDGRLNEVEAEQLGALASELTLSTDTFAEIEREVMGDTKEAILEHQEQAAREKERKEQLDNLRPKVEDRMRQMVDTLQARHGMDIRITTYSGLDEFDESRSLKFPFGHPISGFVYVRHPLTPTIYYQFAEFHPSTFGHKLSEAIRILKSLGTTRITVEYTESDESSPKSMVSEFPKSKVFEFTDVAVGLDLPEDLVWYPHEPAWRELAEKRLTQALQKAYLKVQYTDDFGITIGLSETILDLGLSLRLGGCSRNSSQLPGALPVLLGDLSQRIR